MSDFLMKGIDVSQYQTNVDYKKVKEAGYDFVIIRDGYGKYVSQKDPQCENHFARATENNMHCGFYHYSYATSVEDAKREAETCLTILQGKKFDMPVWYDVEEQKTFAQGSAVVDAIVKTFCSILEQNGYFVGYYCGDWVYTGYLSEYTRNKYAFWLAQYLYPRRFKGYCAQWQFGVAGDKPNNNPQRVPNVPGVNGLCDVNECYEDFPTIIKQKGLNGYTKTDSTETEQPKEEPKKEDNFVYTPRLTIPEKGNKYYNTKSNGGYSTAIVGKPTQTGLNVLSNCFSGDTKIITKDGLVTLDSIVDKDVDVLSKDGIYRKAKGGYYGKQRLYNITFNNGDSFKCTDSHRWYVKTVEEIENKIYTTYQFKETKDLTKNDLIPYVYVPDTECSNIATVHGFTFGSGCYSGDKKSIYVTLTGKKKDYLNSYFSGNEDRYIDSDGSITYAHYPISYKEVPDTTCDLAYLRGFIRGLIASDGYIEKYGFIAIPVSTKENADKISEICSILGYRNTVKHTTIDSIIYNVTIKADSIPKDIILDPKLKDLKEDKTDENAIRYITVTSITDTGIDDDVYCVSEPETHTFTLDGCILTGNCVGYAFGRFNEIIGENACNYLLPVNAENFVDVALSQGLVVNSTTPSLGSIMVWAKGKKGVSEDGCGHVCIVETIKSNDEVVTSESGYGCSTPFWTQTRKRGNGNWGQNSAYTFLGFIENPKVKGNMNNENRAPYPVPTNTVKENNNNTPDEVKWLQWYLVDLHYSNDPIDGIFGVYTLGALLAFQFKNCLDPDGSCGPATKSKLLNAK